MSMNGLDVAGLDVGVVVSGDEAGLMVEEGKLAENCGVETTEINPTGDKTTTSRSKVAIRED